MCFLRGGGVGGGGALCCQRFQMWLKFFSFSVMLYYEIKENILLKMSTEFPLITDYPDWVWFLPHFYRNDPAVPTISQSISVGLSDGANLGVLKRINILLSEVILMPLPQCFQWILNGLLFVCLQVTVTKGSGRFVPTPCNSEAVYGRLDARNKVGLMILCVCVRVCVCCVCAWIKIVCVCVCVYRSAHTCMDIK